MVSILWLTTQKLIPPTVSTVLDDASCLQQWRRLHTRLPSLDGPVGGLMRVFQWRTWPSQGRLPEWCLLEKAKPLHQ